MGGLIPGEAERTGYATFRTWAGRLITTVACYYILYGSWLLIERSNAFAF